MSRVQIPMNGTPFSDLHFYYSVLPPDQEVRLIIPLDRTFMECIKTPLFIRKLLLKLNSFCFTKLCARAKSVTEPYSSEKL